MIDELTSGIFAIPDLEIGAISEMELEKITGRVGELTEISFSLRTLNAIPTGGYLSIEFADESL